MFVSTPDGALSTSGARSGEGMLLVQRLLRAVKQRGFFLG